MVAWPTTTAVRELIGELYEPETRTKLVATYANQLGAEKVLSSEKIEELAALSTMEGLKLKTGEIKELVGELYEKPDERPKLVAGYATALGAEKVLSAEKIEELAALSTVEGLKGKTSEVKEFVAPYIAKVYDADGRKELVNEATDLASDKVIEPVRKYTTEKLEAFQVAGVEYASEKVLKPASEKVAAAKEIAAEKATAVKELAAEKVLKPTKELAAPYIAKSSEMAAPYIARMETKRAEIVASKRYEKAIAALQQAREHPIEMASELKTKAIDLLKYDNLASYREYIQSEEFQADTLRLIKVELPTIAADAASRGVDQVKTVATSLASDIDAKRGQIVAAIERGYSAARKVELADLKDKMKLLVAELQTEVAGGVESVKADGFSLADTIARMKNVVGAIDSILIAPLLTAAEATAVDGPTTEVAPANLPAGGSPEAEAEEDTFDDAQENPVGAD